MPKPNKDLTALWLRQVERRTARLRKAAIEQPPGNGWLHAIRTALGITTTQAAKRLGMNQASYLEMERREANGEITLKRLRSAAAAFECELVYALVPRQSLTERRARQARAYAARVVNRSSHTMRLEDQAISAEEREAAVDELADDLLRSWSARIWDEPEGGE